MNKRLILASKSPRRQQLLAQLGYEFDSLSADVDESVRDDEAPADYVIRVALDKARAIADRFTDLNDSKVILAADTCVVVEHQILGQPKDQQDSAAMLRRLSGRTHQVYTGLVILSSEHPARFDSVVVCSDVSFKTLSDREIQWYWHSGEPQDKAGSYGIQGIAGQFVTRINGSYSAIVGLPLYETAQLLARYELPTTAAVAPQPQQ